MLKILNFNSFKLVGLSVLISFSLFINPVFAITNTQSLLLNESGTKQYASITDGSQTGLDITGDITLEAWVKLDSVDNTSHSPIIMKGDGHSDAGYALYLASWGTNDYRLAAAVSETSNWSTQARKVGTTNLYNYIGTWVHVAATWQTGSGNSIKLYVNGVEESAVYNLTGASSIRNNSGPFALGGQYHNGSFNESFDGAIDEARVWNDVRTSTEISDNMMVSLTGSESNLVSYWSLNATTSDKTSNSNALTLANSPVYSEEPAHQLMCSFSGMF